MTTKWSYHSFTKTSMSFSSQKEHNFVHPSTAVCEQHRRDISQNSEHLFSFLDTQTHASVQTLQLHGVPSVSTNSWLARKGRINGRVFTSPVECDKSFHAPWRVYAFLFSFCVDLIYAFMLLGCQSGVELNGTAPHRASTGRTRMDWDVMMGCPTNVGSNSLSYHK